MISYCVSFKNNRIIRRNENSNSDYLALSSYRRWLRRLAPSAGASSNYVAVNCIYDVIISGAMIFVSRLIKSSYQLVVRAIRNPLYLFTKRVQWQCYSWRLWLWLDADREKENETEERHFWNQKLETTSENADSMITGRLELWAIVAPRCADIRYINLICTRTCTHISSSKRTLLNRVYPYFKVIVPALV